MSLRNDLPEVQAYSAPETMEFDVPESTEAKFNGAIQAADTNEENSIQIYGEIGYNIFTDDDNTERRISAALRRIGNNPVTVNINSAGGNFFNGLAIYNLLLLHPNEVTVNVVALAGSAASIIAMAADNLNVAAGSFLMVHRASGVSQGNYHAKLAISDLLNEIDTAMSEIYAARAGIDAKAAMKWMDRNLGEGSMFSASKAIELGLADRQLEAGEVTVEANYQEPKIPPERAVEKYLVAQGFPKADAKFAVSDIKSNLRDASDAERREAVQNAEREAGIKQALIQLTQTIKN